MKLKRHIDFINSHSDKEFLIKEYVDDEWDTDLTLTIEDKKLKVLGRVELDDADINGSLFIPTEELLKIKIKAENPVKIWENGKELDFHAESELDSSDAWEELEAPSDVEDMEHTVQSIADLLDKQEIKFEVLNKFNITTRVRNE